ncbi:O-methyltransferase family protein [Aspergillus terreus]|uniref:O-methyltransferase family protein n=1 Tax=Aspergillus terreus TaxID=33178 RepID=A0A5M3Z9Y3_ASPTE|nr:hypothetical protein ATETN484_0010016100 [Aspergillus terreus]GFF18211.1 O-methyltransferase family protein [Aspergillus terreus]
MKFEDIGHELTKAMAVYADRLRQEQLPLPTLTSNYCGNHQLKDPQGIAAMKRVIELTQMIHSMTLGPQADLLLISHQPNLLSCLKTAIDLRVHEHVPLQGAILAKDLAAAVQASESFLTRIGYREPRANDVLGFNLAFDTQDTFWEHFKNTETARRFGRAMRAFEKITAERIPTIFPFDELATDGGLIVDIGGGLGQLGISILKHYPNSGLRCIVQDKYADLEHASCHPGLEVRQHDFFAPQPVKGAAAYVFRHIFHNRPDDACAAILRQTLPALDETKSRILICDQVVGDEHESLAALCDVAMLTLFGGKERTLAEWDALLRSVDPRLRIDRVIVDDSSGTSILDVKLQK